MSQKILIGTPCIFHFPCCFCIRISCAVRHTTYRCAKISYHPEDLVLAPQGVLYKKHCSSPPPSSQNVLVFLLGTLKHLSLLLIASSLW